MRHFLAFLLLPSALLADFFTSSFPEATRRTWPGPEYFANRMLDWQVNDGRLECLTGNKSKPMRTVHLLTHYTSGKKGSLEMEVLTGPLNPNPGSKPNPATWTGFLVGVGGSHVDFRISSLCHHWPAQDGGLIVALDGTGRVVLRNNSPKARKSRLFETEKAWPRLPGMESRGPALLPRMPKEVRLHLKAVPNPNEDTYRVTASALTPAGELIHSFTSPSVEPGLLDGNVALASSRSPSMDGPGYWYRDWKVSGTKVRGNKSRALGPVLAAQYTLSRGVLKLTAQLPALGQQDNQEADLFVRPGQGAAWKKVATGKLQDHSFTIPFRVENWDGTIEHAYRIVYRIRAGNDATNTHHFEGIIRRDPALDETFKLAAFTGHHISARGEGNWNHDSIWYPHNDLAAAIAWHNPDLLFFSGDQIYEGGLAGIIRKPPDLACVDYLYHWVRWCWAFRDLTRNRPTICLPDDHDVYHGNIWGSGGKRAVLTKGIGGNAADSGGYQMDPLFVNAVHRTQVSHLPDPADPEPILQGITTYHTSIDYGGLSFAIIADRMWKSSPSVTVKEGNVVNGWFHNKEFDPRKADVKGARLLGDQQLRFLEKWAADWSGRHSRMKVLLSQTIFNNVSTLPKGALNDKVVPGMLYPRPGEYPEDDLSADCDSNGWPQSARNTAIRTFRKGFPFHIAGDQHLASFIQYGVDQWNDSPHAFCVPSIANVWPRRWFPPQPGKNRRLQTPKYTGEFEDGFGNKLTVHAVANPMVSGHKPAALYDRMPGYGIVQFNKEKHLATFECWPRWEDPSKPGAKQYPGWPITVRQADNFRLPGKTYLPTIVVKGVREPVIQVVEEKSGEILYTFRIRGNYHRPKVPASPGLSYTVNISEPGTNRKATLKGLKPAGINSKRIVTLK